jgi:hypothetical protein
MQLDMILLIIATFSMAPVGVRRQCAAAVDAASNVVAASG